MDPDLAYLARNVPAERLALYVRDLSQRLGRMLALTDDKRDAFELAHAKLASAFAQTAPIDRVDVLDAALVGVHELLGDDGFARYMAAVRADVKKVMLE